MGTFFFSWWHRARHDANFLWGVCHQIHHSPARIELLTAFYKHLIEIVADSMLTAKILYLILGTSIEAAGWYNVFAAFGEYFYHRNIRTSLGWLFSSAPEHHSTHHHLDLHKFNYGDITLWDRLFGTFLETEDSHQNAVFQTTTRKISAGCSSSVILIDAQQTGLLFRIRDER